MKSPVARIAQWTEGLRAQIDCEKLRKRERNLRAFNLR